MKNETRKRMLQETLREQKVLLQKSKLFRVSPAYQDLLKEQIARAEEALTNLQKED